MPEVNSHSRFDRFAIRVIAGLLLLVPLLHAGSLADAFSLPKEVALLAGAALLLATAMVSYLVEVRASRLRAPVLVAAGLLAACAILSILPAVNRELAVRGALQVVAGVIIAWGVTRFARTSSAAAVLFSAVLISATLVAIGAVTQVFRPGFFLAPGGWSLLPPGGGGSTLGDVGLSAQFLLLAFPIGIGAAALARGVWRGIAGGCLGLIAVALIFAGGPEPWIVGLFSLALLAATACLRLIGRGGGWRKCLPDPSGNGVRAALIGVVVVISVTALSRLPGVSPSGRLVTPLGGVSLLSPNTGDPQLDRRAAIRGSLSLVGRHPFGVGERNWRHAFLEVAWTRVEDSPFTLQHQAHHAGNSFVEVTVETGIAGGIIFVLLLAALLIQSGRTGRRDPSPDGLVSLTVFNTLGTFCFMAWFGSPFQEQVPALIVWVMAGLAQVTMSRSEQRHALMPFLRAHEQPIPAREERHRLPAWIGFGALVIAGVVSGAAIRDTAAASRLVLAGQRASFGGRAKAAAKALESPEVLRSPDPLPHYLAATSYMELKLAGLATSRYTQVIARSPYFIAAYIGRASAHEQLGRYDLAEQDLDTALSIWPDHLDTLLARAQLDVTRGRLDDGLAGFRRILRTEPSRPEPYYQMGLVLARLGKLDEAIGSFRACIPMDPRYPGLYINLGAAFEEKGMLDMAIRYYLSAASVNPRDSEPRLKLANASHALGRFCDALDSLEAARELEVDGGRREIILGLIDKVQPRCEKMKQRHR